MKNTLKLLFSFLLTFVCLIPVTFAEQKVFVTEGKYVMGDLDSKKDAKVLALIDAKRLAVEQVGAYLENTGEVKNSQLNKDQINALAAGIMTVDVISEDWKASGENTSVEMQIRATTDTVNLQDKVSKMKESDQAYNFKEIQNQLAFLQKELAAMKTNQQKPVEPPDVKKPPTPEMKHKYETVLNDINALEYLEKGNVALMDLRWNDALYVLNKAIELNPDLVEAYTGKSYALYNSNQSKEALPVINRALTINPQSAPSLGVKALILKDQPGKTKLALANANSAIRIKPDSPRLLHIRGEVYAKMGKASLAQNDFKTACDMGAKSACDRAKKVKR
jgi:tetratricopeptide (TPR) repeat protein